jgi:hypothetical protein
MIGEDKMKDRIWVLGKEIQRFEMKAIRVIYTFSAIEA